MKPIHSDCPSRIKENRRQLVMSREDLVRELAVKLNKPNYYGGLLVDKPYIGINFGSARADHI